MVRNAERGNKALKIYFNILLSAAFLFFQNLTVTFFSLKLKCYKTSVCFIMSCSLYLLFTLYAPKYPLAVQLISAVSVLSLLSPTHSFILNYSDVSTCLWAEEAQWVDSNIRAA